MPEGNNSSHSFIAQILSLLVASSVKSISLDSLLAELIDRLPVVLMDSKPLTVTGPDIDVDRAEIVVLLMT